MKLKAKEDRRGSTVHLESGDQLPRVADVPMIVIPRPWSPRVSAQAGRFTYCTRREALDSAILSGPWTELIKHEFSRKKKRRMRQELANLQVHEGTMFPDLDGYARHLAGGGL
jgi:hypothetical protein